MTSDARQDGPVQRVVGWLRAGYPDGVPQQDYVALLGILGRSLTPTELAQVVDALLLDLDRGEAVPTHAEVVERIHDVLKGPPSEEDVHRVSARLAAGGWPLASAPAAPDQSNGTAGGMVGRAVEWLRGGYPHSLPETDYVPLFAVLQRRLSPEEVRAVAERLEANGPGDPGRVDVGVEISRVTAELPSESDIERVRRELDAQQGGAAG